MVQNNLISPAPNILIAKNINNFKNSTIVQDALGKIRPTWNVIKNG